MSTKYQIIIIGSYNSFLLKIKETIIIKLEELGVLLSSVEFLDSTSFRKSYISNAPTFCLYFCDENGYHSDLDIVNLLKDDATLILPVTNDLTQVQKQIPSELSDINAFELKSNVEIERIVSTILEGLSLLRISRKIFISYRRNESQSTAIQLYEKLEKCGFDVFLDTHSIRPGEPFQDELWHRMADSDIVVILNTPGFLDSKWTKAELGEANAMQIGILQLIWPGHKLEKYAQISISHNLSSKDFRDGIFEGDSFYFTKECIDHIAKCAESLRARSLGARQDMLTSEFIKISHLVGKKVSLHPDRYLTFENKDGHEIIVVPAVGIPQSFTINQCEEITNRIGNNTIKKIYLLYDHINIRDKWISHLTWLNKHLPIQTIKVIDAKSWMKKN